LLHFGHPKNDHGLNSARGISSSARLRIRPMSIRA
jgi:hypothetical protein